MSYIHPVTDGHEITSEERLLGSSTRKPKVTVFDASLGKNSLFFPRAAAVVACVDRMPEGEPSPGSASGGEARAAKVARESHP